LADFDLFVTGGGTGGVACARRAGPYGAKVALCEPSRIGGTCVIRGCIPKKLMRYGAAFADHFEASRAYGWRMGSPCTGCGRPGTACCRRMWPFHDERAPQEGVKPMQRQQHVRPAGQHAAPATRRRVRRLLLAAVVSVFGLLLGVLSLAPAAPASVQGALPAAAQPNDAFPNHPTWMGELADAIGQRPLRQVVIPGSHDAGTYATFNILQGLAQAQNIDITGQLNRGSRYFDIRAAYIDWLPPAGADWWINHGDAKATDLRLHQILEQAATWARQPGHEKEIIFLSVELQPSTDPNAPASLDVNCKAFLAAAGRGGRERRAAEAGVGHRAREGPGADARGQGSRAADAGAGQEKPRAAGARGFRRGERREHVQSRAR
jgi:hypothetical protein